MINSSQSVDNQLVVSPPIGRDSGGHVILSGDDLFAADRGGLSLLSGPFAKIGPRDYQGGLTAEQFLLHEIRVAARLLLEGHPVAECLSLIRQGNLFQYPTERQLNRIAGACYKRLAALGQESLVRGIAVAPLRVAAQINLYAMMRYNRLVWDFMVGVIGEKFRTLDFSFSRTDLNAFFSRLQAQHDSVAGWSVSTIGKIKGVLVRSLVETEFLEGPRASSLSPVWLCEDLEQGIKSNGDTAALTAFNFSI